MIEYGANCRYPGNGRDCAIHFAAEYGLMDTMKELLNPKREHPNCGHVDQLDANVNCVLARAMMAEPNNTEMIKFILEQKPDLVTKNRYWVTPITQAAISAEPEVVKMLLDLGQDLKTSDW